MNRLFTAPASRVDTLMLTFAGAQVEVIAAEQTAETASLQITGSGVLVEQAQATFEDGVWSVSVPADGAVRGGGGGSVINTVYGNVTGTLVQSGGDLVGDVDLSTGNLSLGNSGVAGTHQGADPVTVTARVPHHIALISEADSGSLHTRGGPREVKAQTTNGHIRISDADLVRASTVSGRLDVHGGTDIELSTTSGAITFTSTREGVVTVTSQSGDITLAGPHQMRAEVSTASGQIRGYDPAP